jgi:hypothetical protein
MGTPTINRLGCGLMGTALMAGALLVPGMANAQVSRHAFGTGAQFQSYTFAEALGADVANLTLIPLAYTLPIGEKFALDLYGAYANGSVEREGFTYTLQGPVDTRVRAVYQVTPWAVFTALFNLPTGNSSHNSEEAVVASVLSTDILGFQEANWGTGGAVTAGLASAYQAGDWGVGIGASYRLSNGFEPMEGEALTYQQGNEIRIRLGMDRNVGETGKLTAGFTFQNYSEDQYEDAATQDMKNLFHAGNRLRGDLSYGFRTGRSTWALYGVDVWRESGDAFLDLVDSQGTVVGDTTVTEGSQNLLIVGVNGSTPIGSFFRIRPSVDFRYQSKEDEVGEGWIVGAGADIPLRLFGAYDIFPRAKYSYGALKAATGETETLWGIELGFTLRWQR